MSSTAVDTHTYMVNVFYRLRTGDLAMHVLKVQVAQSIEWVRKHIDEIVKQAPGLYSPAATDQWPIVALGIETA